MPHWLIWLIAAGVLAAAEVATLTFVLVMFAGGAVAGAIAAAAGGSLLTQFVTATAATIALLVGLRPVVRRHLTPDHPGTITNSDALVGREAVVLRQVDMHDGRVRLNGGEWSARVLDRAHVLPPGLVVRVVGISGATAIVAPEQAHFVEGGRQ